MTAEALSTDVPLRLLFRGKVRDVYEAGASELLMVASDRVSAFDVVMRETVPRKGEVLTQLTAWWLSRLQPEVEHHLLAVDPEQIVRLHPELAESRRLWERRAMLVRRTEPIAVECVVRGYLSGSAWKEYRASGTLAGEPLPGGMVESQKLPRPLFSPATKAQHGHDENITPGQVRELLGEDLAGRLERLSLHIYDHGSRACDAAGILLADTKFEFGLAGERLLLIDEVMTPDSSRFWPKQSYQPGRGQPSLDKQPIRDWLEALPDWDKTPPPPPLAPEVVARASARYLEIFRRLTGVELDDFRAPAFRGVRP